MPEEDRYDRSSKQISRQFTDAETAVGSRLEQHLTEQVDSLPPALLRGGGGTAQQRYAWLDEDLKKRDEATKRLDEEFSLAAKHSARLKLASDAVEETTNKDQATDAIKAVSSWRLEKNDDGSNKYSNFEHALQNKLEESPELAGNKEFLGRAKALAEINQTDASRQIEANKEKIAEYESKFLAEGAEAFAENYGSDPEFHKVMAQARKNGFDVGATNAKLAKLTAEHSLKEAERIQELTKGVAADPDNQESLARFSNYMSKAGFEIANPISVINKLSAGSPEIRMISNAVYLDGALKAKGNENMKGELDSALKILEKTNATEDEIIGAKGILRKHAGEYLEYEDQIKLQKDARTDIGKYSPSMRTITEDVRKRTSSLVKSGMEAVAENKEENKSAISYYKKTIPSEYITAMENISIEAKALGIEAPVSAEIRTKMNNYSNIGDPGAINTAAMAEYQNYVDQVNKAFMDKKTGGTTISPTPIGTKPPEPKKEESIPKEPEAKSAAAAKPLTPAEVIKKLHGNVDPNSLSPEQQKAVRDFLSEQNK